jgi:hypothetical protein
MPVAFDFLYELNFAILYPVVMILIVGATELGHRTGLRLREMEPRRPDLGTLTGAALGLLALLLAFSFSIALSRFDARRDLVLQEANAIGSTANFALMLPEPARQPVLSLLRDYTAVRIGLGITPGQSRLEHAIARSLDLQARLWQQAVAVTQAEPQSLPVYRFVASLNEVNNIHERRITALRYHVPIEVVFMLTAVALVAMAFAGYNAGITGTQRSLPPLIMAVTVAALIVLVVDLDRPHSGLIQVPNQALVDAAQSLPR